MRSATLPHLELPIRERPLPPRLVREARRLARPVLRALESGKLSVADLANTRSGHRRRSHPLVECLARLLAERGDYFRVSRLGIEKDGVILAGGVAFKIGHRASVEADLYASNPDKHDILAEAYSLAPCLVAMERAEALRDTTPEEREASPLGDVYEEGTEGYRRMRRMHKFTCDAHEGNVGLTRDGRYVLIDYSFDVEAPRHSDD